jgi:hypothetical protein
MASVTKILEEARYALQHADRRRPLLLSKAQINGGMLAVLIGININMPDVAYLGKALLGVALVGIMFVLLQARIGWSHYWDRRPVKHTLSDELYQVEQTWNLEDMLAQERVLAKRAFAYNSITELCMVVALVLQVLMVYFR